MCDQNSDGKLLRKPSPNRSPGSERSHPATEDHSFVTELVKRGRISEEEATSHPQRNIVTRALGTQPTVEADFYEEAIQPGDTIILCTDGL
jgi:serine/threonine protein phosphatase PrpC